MLLVEVQSLLAVSDVSSGNTVDLTLSPRSNRRITRVVHFIGRFDSAAIFALGDGS